MNDAHHAAQQPASMPQTAQEIPQSLYETERPAPLEKGPAPPPSHDIHAGDAKHAPTCAICQLSIQERTPVKHLCCAHLFHAFCIDQWLRNELHCPICKTQVLFPVAEAVKVHEARSNQYAAAAGPSQPPHGAEAASGIPDSKLPMAVPVDGTDVRMYGTCRDCQRVFYRDPKSVRPDTSAWYRCAECRDGDIFDLVRSSCSVQ